MRAPGTVSLCAALLLLAAACGLNEGSQEVRAEAPTVLVVTPAQAPVTTAPATTTTDALSSTTTAAPPDTTVDSTPTSPNEPGLPDGAHHGDQPEIVEHFGEIASDGDCDDLRTERDSDRMARDAYLTQRAADPGARGKAEIADRWMQAAQGRMRTLHCPQTMAMTP